MPTKADCINGEHTIDNQGICHFCGMSPAEANRIIKLRKKDLEEHRELSRKRFEDWMRKNTTTTNWRPNVSGGYDNYEVSLAWMVWQGALGFPN